MPNNTPYIEIVQERFAGHILMSTNRPATQAEVRRAEALHAKGKCPHNIIHDEPGWMYDMRSCVTCGNFLGFI